MCLSHVKNLYDGTSTAIESGWKYFAGTKNDEFPQMKWNNKARCPMNKWITATGGDIGGERQSYKAGFHVYTDENKVRKLIPSGLRRVYFRRVTAVGWNRVGADQEVETIVAQEMYVPSRENAWPPREKGA